MNMWSTCGGLVYNRRASRRCGPDRVAAWSPIRKIPARQPCGVAAVGATSSFRSPATAARPRYRKETGEVAWETTLSTSPRTCHHVRPSRRQGQDHHRGGRCDRGVRDLSRRSMQEPQARLAQIRRTGARRSPVSKPGRNKKQRFIPAAALWVTGTTTIASNHGDLGTCNPVPMFDSSYRPADHLFTDNSVISLNPDDGQDGTGISVQLPATLGLRRGGHPHSHRPARSNGETRHLSRTRPATASSTL